MHVSRTSNHMVDSLSKFGLSITSECTYFNIVPSFVLHSQVEDVYSLDSHVEVM